MPTRLGLHMITSTPLVGLTAYQTLTISASWNVSSHSVSAAGAIGYLSNAATFALAVRTHGIVEPFHGSAVCSASKNEENVRTIY